MSRSTCLSAIVVALTAMPTPAQDQRPVVLAPPSVITVGGNVETMWVEATGKWSDASKDLGATSAHIECYKKFAFCTEAEAYTLGGQALVSTDTLDILRWDDRELIAIDSSPTCQVNEIRFDFAARRVSVSESPKGDTKAPYCKNTKPTVAYLGGLADK